MGHIYCITNLENGMCYIGQTHKTVERRYPGGFRNSHHNRILKDDFNKFPQESFILFVIESVDDEKLSEREKYWAERYGAYYPKGYNLVTRGNAKTFCKSTREKMAHAKRGKPQSPEQIAKRKLAMMGNSLSQESRQKISNSLTGRKHSNERIENVRVGNSKMNIGCTNGFVYNSISEAHRHTGLTRKSIAKSLKSGKTISNLTFRNNTKMTQNS